MGAAIRAAAAALADAGVAEPRLDAQLLMAAALGCDRPNVIIRQNEPLMAEARALFAALLARRIGREPMSHILGVREFWSLPFRVTADTLAPRPDSECMIAAVLEKLRGAPPRRILDFGTGTGCLLLSLLWEFGDAWGLGVDRNPGAATVALSNARALGMAHRAAFLVGDWARAIAEQPCFDLIVSNPPYITSADMATLPPEVRDHEPALALDGGADGLEAYLILLPVMARLVRPGGIVALEFGLGQGNEVLSLAQAAGFTHMEIHADLEGRERVILAVSPLTRSSPSSGFRSDLL